MLAFANLTDQELVAFVSKGDGNAFSEVYNRYWGVLYKHARRMTKDDELAKDVVQDVFVTLWDKRSVLQFNLSLSSYLYATTRNKILNLYEKDKVKSTYITSLGNFMEVGENVTDHLLRERELSVKIEMEIALLPKKMRQVFELSRKSNMSYKEIAENLDISDKTVKKQMNNAIKILRLKLGSLLSITITIF